MLRRSPVGEAEIRNVDVRGRSLRRGRLRGYRRDEVDTFLADVDRVFRDQLSENEALRVGASPPDRWWPAGTRLSPVDVQDRRFHGVWFGGYDMRSVDELLDEVTDLLGALLQERELLRSRAAVDSEER